MFRQSDDAGAVDVDVRVHAVVLVASVVDDDDIVRRVCVHTCSPSIMVEDDLGGGSRRG